MATDELIQAFPECEKIKREDIAECITKAMTEERFYAEASNKVYRKANELWPYQCGLKDDDPERVARRAYFFYDIQKGVKSPFNEWLKTFETEFIAQHGQVRTFDEACQTAADEWARMIFGSHVQNNGDQSDAGGLAMVLGTLAKSKASSGISSDTIEKFRKLCKEYYLGGCRYKEDKYGWMESVPHCDYGPNGALSRLLDQAGVPHDRIGSICPWKTGITINRRDNSVCVHGYQTERYM
jgi:hypothetical protein